jgi:hypothetical protein
MSAVSDISLYDGQATPVEHTFEPVRVKDEQVIYQDKSGDVVIGWPEVILGNRLPSSSNSNYKATVRINLPITETLDGANHETLAYTLRSSHEFMIPNRATAAQRADLMAYAANLIATALVSSLVEDLDLPY